MQQTTVSHFMPAPLRKPRSAPTLRLRQLMEEQQRIEIGRRMRGLREASPQTNRSIADHVGVGERAVANWISGATGIEYGHCKAVASLFKVDVQWLWSGDEKAGGTPDLMTALNGNGNGDRSRQLQRIEAKVDAIAEAVTRALDEEGAEKIRRQIAEADARYAPPTGSSGSGEDVRAPEGWAP